MKQIIKTKGENKNIKYLKILYIRRVSVFLNLMCDNNGNLITGDGKYREYNEFNQLSKVYEGNNDSGDLLEEYVYHPTEDRILAKKVYNKSETFAPVEFVVYVNENFVREVYNLRATPHSNDTYYIKDEMGIVVEIKTNGTNETVLFYHNDHLGSTSVITNESGGVVEKTFYKPFGGMITVFVEAIKALHEDNQMLKQELCKKDSSYGFC